MSPSNSESVGPVGPTGTLSSLVFECASQVGPVKTFFPYDGLSPSVQTGELSSVEAVTFPGGRGSSYYTTACRNAGGELR